MKKAMLLVFACAFLCFSASHAGNEPSAKFVAHLNGEAENPSVDTLGQGQAQVTVSNDGTEVAFKLNVANTRDVTQAHIHCGGPAVNGPVVAFLFGLVPGGVSLNGILAQGTFTNDNIIPRPDSAACPGGITDLDDLIQAMHEGQAYVNVHTIANPSGEIRGQLSPAD